MGKIRGLLSLAGQLVNRQLRPGKPPKLFYIAPNADWIIDWVGRYLTENISRLFDIEAEIISEPRWQIGQILHYGSLWSFVGNLGTPHNSRNSVVATVFHGYRGGKENPFNNPLDELIENQKGIEKLVTASTLMRERFISWGIEKEKIVTIQLGVDLSIFKPADLEQKQRIRKQLGIPEDAFCIGSFHKDGVGWEEGNEPKIIKGPDILLEVIKQLSQSSKLHILLTAPARGFVTKGLDKLGVPYTHQVLENYHDIVNNYHALDAYLVPSREEGGPAGVLESLACGIPLVTTKVGLAPDVVQPGFNGLLVDVEDVEGIVTAVASLIEDGQLVRELVENGLKSIKAYSWENIAIEYYRQVYRPIIERST